MDGGQTNVSYFRSCQKWAGLIGLWCLDTGPKPFKLTCRGWMFIVDVLLCVCAHVCQMQPAIRRDLSILIDSVTHYANG